MLFGPKWFIFSFQAFFVHFTTGKDHQKQENGYQKVSKSIRIKLDNRQPLPTIMTDDYTYSGIKEGLKE